VRIIIGSRRPPKIEGAREGVARAMAILSHAAMDVTYESVAVESGVPPMPRTLQEIQTGARNRARGSFPLHAGDTLAIGLEGGLFPSGGVVFLQSWAAVYDGATFTLGASGAIQVPERLARRVMMEGEDLGEAIDDFAGRENIRSAEGTWGVLTNNGVRRAESFALAVFNALMPVLNRPVYHPRGG
jgi:inosine/xanthosine triphosphatase